MAKELKQGDKVAWKAPQGEVKGVVEKKLTSKTRIKGHTAEATKDDPEYLVKSEKTGAKASHKPEQLKKG